MGCSSSQNLENTVVANPNPVAEISSSQNLENTVVANPNPVAEISNNSNSTSVVKTLDDDDVEIIDNKNITLEQAASLSDEQISLIESGKTVFLKKLKAVDTNRDYIIIIDKSASMKEKINDSNDKKNSKPLKSRWQVSEEVVVYLVTQACKCNPDGITLYFFSAVNSNVKVPFIKYKNIKTVESVISLFKDKANQPQSGTDMTSVLSDAINVEKTSKPLTILMITDGTPANPKTAMETIIKAANNLERDEDLSISFIQIGNDKSADEFLNKLDNNLKKLGSKFDIVDTVTSSSLQSMDFVNFIKKSIED